MGLDTIKTGKQIFGDFNNFIFCYLTVYSYNDISHKRIAGHAVWFFSFPSPDIEV